MKKDITTPEDVRLLVDSFYEKVRRDQTIGYIFNDVARVNWPVHLPRMYAFWESIVFQTASFSGNPMVAHIELSRKHPLTAAHFDRWLELFRETVDELFEGEKATMVKKRAQSIAGLMLIKVTAAAEK